MITTVAESLMTDFLMLLLTVEINAVLSMVS